MPNCCYNTITIHDKPKDFVNRAKYSVKDTKMFDKLPASAVSKDVIALCIDDSERFDFNKIIPMPEDIRDTTSGSESSEAIEVYISVVKPRKQPYKGKQPLDEIHFRELLEAANKERLFNKIKDTMSDESLDKVDNFEETYALGEKLCRNLKEYGSSTWYRWAINCWSTKWNAYRTEVSDEGATVSFETAWSPPVNVLAGLSSLYPDVVIRNEWWEEGGGASNLLFIGGVCYERAITRDEFIERTGYDYDEEAEGDEEETEKPTENVDDTAGKEPEEPPTYIINAVFER